MTQARFGMSTGLAGLTAVSFVALAVVFSDRAMLGLVIPEWEKDFGWSRSLLSGIGATAQLMMAVVAPFAGALVDRQGPRLALLIGLGAAVAGAVVISLSSHPVPMLIGYGIISAVGFGLVANHVVSTAIARATTTARGLATGIATSGSTGGQFAVMPALAALLAVASWRWSFAAVAVAAALLMPVVYFVLPREKAIAAEKSADGEVRSLGEKLRFLIASPTFHVLFWSFFICGYTTTGVIETHLIPYAAFCGFPPLPSATAYGLLSLVNLCGMVLAGYLTDRVNRPLLLGSIYVLRGLTFIYLMQIGSDYERLLFFAVAFGMVDYATVPVTASLVASHLGLRIMGLAMGLISAGHALGGAAGALAGGLLYDASGNYDWLWRSAVAIAIVAGLAVYTLRDRPPETKALPA